MSRVGERSRDDPRGRRAEEAAFWPGRSLRRWIYALLGILSVGVGFVGVFVPGLPTTVFLLLASWLFTRSCPWLEERLVRAPIFRPYLRYLEGDAVMPTRARIVTIAMIWGAVGTSFVLMGLRDGLAAWFIVVVGGAAVVGTGVVWRFRREPKDSRSSGVTSTWPE